MNKFIAISFIVVVLIIESCNPMYFGKTIRYSGDDKEIKHAQVNRLDLSNQQLEKLPQDISKYANIQTINLSSNPDLILDSVFRVLSHFPKLKVVMLDSNRIEEIPANIIQLKELSDQFIFLWRSERK